MPYIKLEDRAKFALHIIEVLEILKSTTETLYIKGEYIGFFVNRLTKKFLGDPNYAHNSFNSAFFNDSKKKTLANCADSIAASLNRADPLGSAGDFNYAITAVLWGFLGEAEGFSQANYGLRAYLRGIVERVLATTDSINTGSQSDMTMAFRRHLVIRGVLADIIDETYRCVTAPYEDGKISQNGTIWESGKLFVVRQAEAQ